MSDGSTFTHRRPTGKTTTGHEWDGITELNTPLPRWWLWTLLRRIVWAVGYWIVYPAWPLVTGSTEALLGWHSRSRGRAGPRGLQDLRGPTIAKLASRLAGRHREDAGTAGHRARPGRGGVRQQLRAVPRRGRAGRKGYPNLNADRWLWGGTLRRSRPRSPTARAGTPIPTRMSSLMPAFGRDGILKPDQIVATSPTTCARCRACRPSAGADLAKRQEDLRRQLRGLPRRRGQGQPGDRRART